MSALQFTDDTLGVAVNIDPDLHDRCSSVTPVNFVSMGFGASRGISTERHDNPLIPNAIRVFSATGDWGLGIGDMTVLDVSTFANVRHVKKAAGDSSFS
ncbi:MAG: hypothetical protein QM488_03045 [Rhizobiaceae bacterium]